MYFLVRRRLAKIRNELIEIVSSQGRGARVKRAVLPPYVRSACVRTRYELGPRCILTLSRLRDNGRAMHLNLPCAGLLQPNSHDAIGAPLAQWLDQIQTHRGVVGAANRLEFISEKSVCSLAAK